MKYRIPYDFYGSLDRLRIYIFRKFPTLQCLNWKRDLGEWPTVSDQIQNKLEFGKNESQILYLGHRTVYIQLEGVNLITDPVFSKRFFPLGVKRVSNRYFKYWLMPPVDFVLLSNNSFDCLSTWSLRIISVQSKAILVGGRNITKYTKILYEGYTYPLDWYEGVNFGVVEIIFLPAMSESKREFLCCGIDRNKLLYGSFLIKTASNAIFYAGKTNFSTHFEEISNYIKKLNLDLRLAILPIGPQFHQSYNLTPEDAVKVHSILNPKKSLIIAHDTFPIGIEGFGELKSRLISYANSQDPWLVSRFIFLNEGESHVI